ncbi:inositol monophosphatase family protein [Bailinhaonella thermotolerans]|uniref:inositol monophosphatase family protein n=1 Tax=Bailinhaonella thermotolerans TaxID=1070861 RepID=UPI00192A3186|nr:inositol monophosphatase family protein [Bailinhaonella thermotolerans]
MAGDGEREELARTAADAATAVGDLLREAFRSRGMGVEFKEDHHDPVTEHDREAERVIRALILERHPGSRIVGEEQGPSGDGPAVWYVDPIDGTANFTHGMAMFCTSVGVELDGELVAGAIYDPVRDELFTAGPEGAFLNGTPIRAAGAGSDERALLLTGYPSPGEAREPGALERFGDLVTGFGTLRRPGSAALALAHVACGWADVALSNSIKPWDVAAGYALVTRAGGRYVPLRARPGEPPWLAPGYLAAVGEYPLETSAAWAATRPWRAAG